MYSLTLQTVKYLINDFKFPRKPLSDFLQAAAVQNFRMFVTGRNTNFIIYIYILLESQGTYTVQELISHRGYKTIKLEPGVPYWIHHT